MAAEDPRYVMPYQYGNPANPQAHYETTGPEILADCPEIDAFVAGLGTGGHADGRRALPARAPAGGQDLRRRAAARRERPGPALARRGVRAGDLRPVGLLDGKFLVSNRDAVVALRDLVAKEGIFAGPSSGAVLVAAARVARRLERGTIVALLPDGGWKYLSAGTYERDLDEMEDDLEGGVNWW